MTDITRTMHVLAVPDAAATAAFFVDKLGFELLPVEDDGWRFLHRGACRVMAGSCPDAIPPGDLGDHNYFGYFVVDDIDPLFAEYKARGVTFRQEVADKPWGMREFGIETPDGHRIMFGQDLD